MGRLRTWTDLYPQGTKEGDEEFAFFVCLSRNPKHVWQTVKGISSDTGISVERVEKIIQKYYKLGVVINNSSNEDSWAYWELVPDHLPPKKESVIEKDHKERMKKISKGSAKA